MRDLWDDLRSVEIAVDGGKPFEQWSPKALNRLAADVFGPTPGSRAPSPETFDQAVGDEIDRIRKCSGCDAVEREEFLRQIEKSAYIGYQDGAKAGYGLGAAATEAKMESAARKRAWRLRGWWFLVGAVVAALVSFWLKG